MKKHIPIVAIALLAAVSCKARTQMVLGATPAVSPPNSVVVVDSPTLPANVYNNANPFPVGIGGTIDGGAATNVDPEPASLLSTLVVQPVPVTQQILIDAGTRCVTDINFTNEGTVGGYAQVFCGQYAPDASGTAGSATAPSLQIRCPAGTICGVDLSKAPLCCAGAVWYSGVDAGFLLTTSAPAMTLTTAAIR